MLKNAQEKYDFFETPKTYANKIYEDYKPIRSLNVIDICCGLGSLVLTRIGYDDSTLMSCLN